MRQFLSRLWRSRMAIAAFTLACGGVAALLAWFTPPVYVATAKLYVRPALDPTASRELVNRYRAFFDDPAVTRQVLEDTHLDKPPFSLTVSRLQSAMTAQIPPAGNAIVVEVQLGDAMMAARAATSAARRVLDAARRQDQTSSSSLSSLRTQLASAEAELAKAQETLVEFRRASQIEKLRADVTAMIQERERLPEVVARMEGETTRLKEAEARLAQTPRTILLKKEIGGAQELSDEAVNPVYDALAREVVASQISLAALASEKQSASGALNPQALSALDAGENRLSSLMDDVAQARNLRNQFADSYQQAADLPPSQFPMEVIDEAAVPNRPVTPQMTMNVSEGVAVGLLLSVIAAALLHVFFRS
jgi:uncharacterized protein involved in exopolysaccharide biosynthesis